MLKDFLKERCFAVNYHYVEDPSPETKGIFPCAIADFERAVAFLSQKFKVVPLDELYSYVGDESGKGVCAITFDDGLRDQFKNAVPILKKYAAPATFFIISGTLEGKLSPAHKIHQLASRFSYEGLADRFDAYLQSSYPEYYKKYRIPRDERLNPTLRLRDEIIVANLKEIMGLIPDKLRDGFFGYMFQAAGLSEAEVCRDLFMSRKEIEDLIKAGFGIASHSHSHHSFETMESSALERDIKTSQEFLSKEFGVNSPLFSYPHGRYTKDSGAILANCGFRQAFTTERRSIAAQDQWYSLPRFDAADLKDYLYESRY